MPETSVLLMQEVTGLALLIKMTAGIKKVIHATSIFK